MANARARHAALWSGYTTSRETISGPSVSALSLPGFQRLEDFLTGRRPSDLDQDMADRISFDTFGLTLADTLYAEGREPSDDITHHQYQKFLQARRDHEAKLEVSRTYLDEERVEVLLMLGLDFRDGFGNPLRSTRLVCRQAEFAIRYRGWKPRHVLARPDVWESQLEQAAEEWQRKKKV